MVLGLGLLTLPESTRWLTKKGRHDEAWGSLQWIRADSSGVTAAEMAEIRAGVLDEARATEGFQVKGELFYYVHSSMQPPCSF